MISFEMNISPIGTVEESYCRVAPVQKSHKNSDRALPKISVVLERGKKGMLASQKEVYI